MNSLNEFVFAGDGTLALARLADGRFGLADGGRPVTVRRAWLDTFDWRLYLAGLTLESRSGHGATELVLTGRGGELIATQRLGGGSGGQPRWPCTADGLPLGPLREHLGPVIGVRALLPVARATSVLTRRRAVNSDDKTIAMLTVDQTAVSFPRRAAVLPRLSVTALRGYQAQTARLTDALGRAPGMAVAVQAPIDAVLAAAGRKPGDYTAKIDVRLTSEMPAAQAVATVLASLFDIVRANHPGTIRDIDTEFLHDLRVAVRRTRSVLKTVGGVLPGNMAGRYRPEFKWLGDLTTPTRDLDVYLLGYPSMARGLVAAAETELRPFHDHLRRQRASAQRELVRGLRSARFARLASQWTDALEQVAQAPPRRPLTGKLAARRIARMHQRVLDDGRAITPASPPVQLHELRKRCKELRYLLEIFASLHDPAQQWRAVNELKSLQDCLGDFQDNEVQQDELRRFAEQMMADRSAPAATLLAMGEIAAALAARQRRARGEFGGRFAEFASPSGVARISALTAAGTARRPSGAAKGAARGAARGVARR